MKTYHYELRQGEARRLRFTLHDAENGGEAAPPVSLEGVAAEFRIQFGDLAEVFPAAIEDDVVTVDFGAIDTSEWQAGRWAYQVWLRWTPADGWEPRFGGDFKVEKGILA